MLEKKEKWSHTFFALDKIDREQNASANDLVFQRLYVYMDLLEPKITRNSRLSIQLIVKCKMLDRAPDKV